MSKLAFSCSFEYLIYVSTAIIKIIILSVRGQSLYVRIYRCQILTYKDCPRTVRVNVGPPYTGYACGDGLQGEFCYYSYACGDSIQGELCHCNVIKKRSE